jgi:hypothetical protein
MALAQRKQFAPLCLGTPFVLFSVGEEDTSAVHECVGAALGPHAGLALDEVAVALGAVVCLALLTLSS